MAKPETAKMRATPHRKVVLLNQRSQEIIRSRIRGAQIVDRLQKFVLREKHGRSLIDMTDAEVRAAFGLLAKIVPDLARIELTGGEDIGTNITAASAARQTADVLAGLQSVVDASMEYQRLMFDTPEQKQRLQLPAIEGSVVVEG